MLKACPHCGRVVDVPRRRRWCPGCRAQGYRHKLMTVEQLEEWADRCVEAGNVYGARLRLACARALENAIEAQERLEGDDDCRELMDRLVAMLKRLEWLSDYWTPTQWLENRFCPICEASQAGGHEEGCELAALLAELDNAGDV